MTSPLAVGVIGAGGIAAAHLGAIRRHPEHVRTVAVCDLNEHHARQRADLYGVDSIYLDAADMLREATLDAVVICTTSDQHAPLAIQAAEAGKHVLVEKPMATSMADARAMVAAADRAGVTLMAGQCERYHPSYAALRGLVGAGELGEIRALRVDAMQSSDGMPPGHWLLDGNRAGGGVVVSVGVHRIDLARFLIGDLVRVSASCRTIAPKFVNGAEDFAVARLEFAGGAIGEFFATWNALRLPWSESLMLFGDEGVAHAVPCPPQQLAPAVVASRRSVPAAAGMGDLFGDFSPVEADAATRSEHMLTTDNMFDNQILHFARCCRTGREPWSSGRDNLGTMAAIFAIYASARRDGAPVELAEV